jgi:TonB-dependent receptor
LATGVGGENNLGGFILDYKASFASADQNVPFDYGYGFTNTNLTGSLTYNNSKNNGNSPTINLNNMTGQNDASQFDYTGSSNGTSDYKVDQYGLKADGKFDTPLGGDDTGTVKFGAATRFEYSVFNQVSLTSTQTGTLTMNQVLDPNNYSFYPGNIYNMGPLPSLNLVTSLFNGPNAYQGPYFQNDPVGDQGGDYNNWEDVYAAYAMDTIKAGPMEIMGGVRIETTHIQYNWFQSYGYDSFGNVNTSDELSAPIAHTGTINYTNVLPSLGMKYTFNPDFVTRVNYSQTIARPTQNQYIPSFSLGQALDAQSGNSIVSFTFGNPNLKPMVSNNIDSSWEFYPQKGAILAADFFIKDITNYFATDYSVADNSGGVTNTVSYVNIPYSQIYGAEFQYQQQYTMLPDPFDGLGFRGSISFIGSRGEIVPNVYSELPSQSDLIWNTGVFYKKGGFTFDIGGSFTGKNLTTIGDPSQDNSPNIYYDDYFQIDAKAQYAFSDNFSIFADGNNLNNANHRFYQGSSNFPIQNEYYDPTFDGGAKIDF